MDFSSLVEISVRGFNPTRPLFRSSSVSRLVESVAIAASQATYADDEPSIALGEAARLYLGRNGLAKFLLSINSNRTNQNGSYSAANKRLFDLKFPLGMILQFKARLFGM